MARKKTRGQVAKTARQAKAREKHEAILASAAGAGSSTPSLLSAVVAQLDVAAVEAMSLASVPLTPSHAAPAPVNKLGHTHTLAATLSLEESVELSDAVTLPNEAISEDIKLSSVPDESSHSVKPVKKILRSYPTDIGTGTPLSLPKKASHHRRVKFIGDDSSPPVEWIRPIVSLGLRSKVAEANGLARNSGNIKEDKKAQKQIFLRTRKAVLKEDDSNQDKQMAIARINSVVAIKKTADPKIKSIVDEQGRSVEEPCHIIDDQHAYIVSINAPQQPYAELRKQRKESSFYPGEKRFVQKSKSKAADSLPKFAYKTLSQNFDETHPKSYALLEAMVNRAINLHDKSSYYVSGRKSAKQKAYNMYVLLKSLNLPYDLCEDQALYAILCAIFEKARDANGPLDIMDINNVSFKDNPDFAHFRIDTWKDKVARLSSDQRINKAAEIVDAELMSLKQGYLQNSKITVDDVNSYLNKVCAELEVKYTFQVQTIYDCISGKNKQSFSKNEITAIDGIISAIIEEKFIAELGKKCAGKKSFEDMDQPAVEYIEQWKKARIQRLCDNNDELAAGCCVMYRREFMPFAKLCNELVRHRNNDCFALAGRQLSMAFCVRPGYSRSATIITDYIEKPSC